MEKKEVPIFVKVEDYKDILEIMEAIQKKLGEARDMVSRINELKNAEDNELDVWNSEIDEVDRKMNFIDRTLFSPQGYEEE